MCKTEIKVINHLSGKRIYLDTLFSDTYLTLREAEILLVLEGNTYAHIAHLLGISKRTVEFYVTNIRKKFQCNSKASLIKFIRNVDIIKQLDILSNNCCRIDRFISAL